MAEETNNRVKVIGYAQRTFYDNGIEYRNFADNLVGQQLTDNGGTALFTASNFRVSTNLDPKVSRDFYTGKYTDYLNLDNLNISEAEIRLVEENSKVKLNLDRTNLRNYAYFGSLIEYIRVSVEGIIMEWPASLYLTKQVPFSLSTGDTIQSYSYNPIRGFSEFKVPTNLIRNNFEINYLNNGAIIDSFSDGNDLRNLVVNYKSYVFTINDVDYNILNFAGAKNVDSEYIFFRVEGNPISGTSSTESFHIKPNKTKREEFFNYLGDFETHLLNRFLTPQYTSEYKFPVTTDTGIVLYKQKKLTWPTTDGYNIDFNTDAYTAYITELLEIGENQDGNLADYMVRVLVAESISDFDTVQKCDNSLEETAGQKMTKTLRIYGREFDEIKRKIDGIQYANTVSYDKQNNTPNVVLKNVARTLGWGLTNSMLGNDLLASYLDIQESSYAGESRGLSPLEAEHELWRRLILNSAWLWKSKGTRKGIEFLFRFIGAPEGLMTLNEYLYVSDGKIDTDLLQAVLEKQNLDTDLDLYNVDSEGYPKAFNNTTEMYFQKGGAWYRETGGSGSTKHILDGNNPHVGPYDGGKAYMGQFETLVPNFTAVTITEEVVTSGSTNIFTNYNSGFFNDLLDETVYTDFETLGSGAVLTSSIIDDPMPSTETTDCGCETGQEDRSLLLEYGTSNNNTYTMVSYSVADGTTAGVVGIIAIKFNGNLSPFVAGDIIDLTQTTIDGTYELLEVIPIPNPTTVSHVLRFVDVGGTTLSLPTFLSLFGGFIGLTSNGSGGSGPLSAHNTRINANLDNGGLFHVEDDETCVLDVNFDYLFKFDCDDLITAIDGGVGSISEVFENFTVNWSLDVKDGNNIGTIYEEELFNITDLQDYVTNSINTGIYLSGDNCNAVTQRLVNEFGDNCDLITDTTFNSDWLTLSHQITDVDAISAITNSKISISIKLVNSLTSYGVLLDRIELNKDCTEVQRTDNTITSSPGFTLMKTVDNKKSWVASDARDDRGHDLKLRKTRYDINHHKLGINNKEIDLNFDYAKPIECDLFSYYQGCPFETNEYASDCPVDEPTPVDTNIYVFYDSTSLAGTQAVQASASVNEWFNGFKGDNPLYVGELYELVVGKGGDNGENWLGWSTYPYYGKLSGFTGTMDGSGAGGGSAVPYASQWCSADVGGNCVAKLPQLNNSGAYQNINKLPPGAASPAADNPLAGDAAWSGGDVNAIVIMIVDEADIASKCYHGNQQSTLIDGLIHPEFIGEPTHRWEGEYDMFLDAYQKMNFFRGFVYPKPRKVDPGNWCNFILHVAGAIEGELVPPTAIDRIPVNTICNEWVYDRVTTEAPYSSMTQSLGYQSLPAESQNGAGLKNFGWGTDYNVTSFTPEQFSTSLDNFLLADETVFGGIGASGTTNPSEFLSIDPTDSTLSYEEKLKSYSTELIDVKSRKIMPAYPLLRKIYDDYLDLDLRCVNKAPINYDDTIKFGELVDNFWVDLVEQVMPSTAMWGSTYVYRNSAFDENKFQYKKYTLFNGDDLGSLPFPPIAVSENVEFITTDITNPPDGPECAQVAVVTSDVRNVAIAQMDCGSEFYGSITVIDNNGFVGGLTINNCDISIDDILLNNQPNGLTTGSYICDSQLSNAITPIIYAWEIIDNNTPAEFLDTNGLTSQLEAPTLSYDLSNTLSITIKLTVTDDTGCEISANKTITGGRS